MHSDAQLSCNFPKETRYIISPCALVQIMNSLVRKRGTFLSLSLCLWEYFFPFLQIEYARAMLINVSKKKK